MINGEVKVILRSPLVGVRKWGHAFFSARMTFLKTWLIGEV